MSALLVLGVPVTRHVRKAVRFFEATERLAAKAVVAVSKDVAARAQASMRRRPRRRVRSPPVIVRSYGPAMATSVSMPSFAATATASATVMDPPPAGTTPEPLELAAPLLTFTESVPPAQLAEMPPTVTLDTLAPELTGTMVTPSVSQRGTA